MYPFSNERIEGINNKIDHVVVRLICQRHGLSLINETDYNFPPMLFEEEPYFIVLKPSITISTAIMSDVVAASRKTVTASTSSGNQSVGADCLCWDFYLTLLE